MKANKSQFLIATLLLSFVIAGCGANKVQHTIDGNGDFSSRVDPTDDNNSGGGGNAGLIAECNAFDSDDIDLKGQTSTYYSGGVYVPDRIRVRFEDLPSEVLSGDQYIQAFRWGETVTGGTMTNDDPVQMYILQRGTGEILNGDTPITSISVASLESIIAAHQLGDKGVTVANFFEKNFVIMAGMDLEYDALVMALYDPSEGTEAISWETTLIPAFSADPNVYARNHRSLELEKTHPMYDRRNSGLSEAQFLHETNMFCTGFFQ